MDQQKKDFVFSRDFKMKSKSKNQDNYKWELCYPPTSRLGITVKDYNGSVYTHMSLLSRQESKKAVSISFRSDEMELIIASIPELEKCLLECAQAIKRAPRQPIEGYTMINRPEPTESDEDADDERPPPRIRQPARKMRKALLQQQQPTEGDQPIKKRKLSPPNKKGITQRLIEEDSDESSSETPAPSKRRNTAGKQQQNNNAPARRVVRHNSPSSSSSESDDDDEGSSTKPSPPRVK